MSKKFSLGGAIKIAESRGGKCLSKEYINCEIPMLWELAKELACSKNGRCISENYVNNSSPLLWECKNNHQFRLSLSDVKNKGSWCRECMKLGFEFAQNLANKRGGMCISSSYHNRRTPLS
ncbi:unnamed protein product [Rhizophagus irregularis]|nr:unnamed protein product [Rhizophagus irregularis]